VWRIPCVYGRIPKDAACQEHEQQGALLDSRECGCFFCIKLFSPEKITDWINEETAGCPFCNVDSVIPESYDYELDEVLLLAMKEYWF
jgi:hypothetical protein